MSSPDLRGVLLVLLLSCDADEMAPLLSSSAAARVEAPAAVGTPLRAAGDLDGDGDIDLVVASGQRLQPRYNDGQGNYTSGTLVDWPTLHAQAGASGFSFKGVEIGDFDGDGFNDILAWISLVTMGEYYPYNPDDPQWWGSPYWQTVLRVTYGSAAGIAPQLVADQYIPNVAAVDLRFVGDVDGDDDDDLAMEFTREYADFFYSFAMDYFDQSTAHPGQVPTFYQHGPSAAPVAVAGDTNGDGLADDLVGADGLSGVRWRAGDTSRATALVESPDWDLVWNHNRWEAVTVRAWDPDWSWTPPAEPYDGLFPEVRGHFVQGLADVNDDGFGDAALVEQVGTQHVDWFLGDADGYGAGPVGTLLADSSDTFLPSGVVAADFDGDGARELVALVETRAYQRLLLFYAPVPGVQRPYRTLAVSGGHLRAPGDVNGDGVEDLLILGYPWVEGTLVHGAAVSCPGGPPQTSYLDSDADGHPSSTHAVLVCSQPVGASAVPGADCNDVDATVHPGAVETPYTVDKDCDGQVTAGVDFDRDGYTTGITTLTAYEVPPAGRSTSPGDCDDAQPLAYPGAAESTGSAFDANCDGSLLCYVDADGDGLGVAVVPYAGPSCADAGYATVGTDCDDADPASGPAVWTFPDADGDGAAEAWSTGTIGCLTPGRALTGQDCDDADPAVHPGATELLGGVDEDCNGQGACLLDADDDGFAADAAVVSTRNFACGVGFAVVLGDCDDHDAGRSPALVEVPGGGDEDCDGVSLCIAEVPGGGDEDCDGYGACYHDADVDGFGTSTVVLSRDLACTDLHHAARSGDCDDLDRTAYPGAPDAPQNDRNCDGVVMCYVDGDGDRRAQSAALVPSPDPTCSAPGWAYQLGDCDDADPTRGPHAYEVYGNTIDENCDGRIPCFADQDQDGAPGTNVGYVAEGQSCAPQSNDKSDCNDGAPTVYRGAPEIVGNAFDEDCDGQDAFAIRTAGFVRNNQRWVRVTLSGLPPGTPVRLYANRTNNYGHLPCPVAGQPCGVMSNPIVWATGVMDANGRFVASGQALGLLTLYQGFSMHQGRLGRTMVEGYDWTSP